MKISVVTKQTPLVRKTVALLRRYGSGKGAVELAIDPVGGAEGYRIEQAGAVTRITGHDERGLLYGAGKFMRDPGWRGTAVPGKPVRAIYFASHFHNFYQAAPLAKVERYIDELALWGCNTLIVWFDMHDFTGRNDPAARAMVARLRSLLRRAQAVGMQPGLMLLANEAYASSPEKLRADWHANNGYFAEPSGHYKVELCPNQPGGLELILRWRGEMLDAFAGVDFKFFVIWPYDQGGCSCARCAPWGANGFLKTAEPLARMLRKRYPRAAVVLSTWKFDKFTTGEWAGLQKAFATKPDWVDYLMADDSGTFPKFPLLHGIPGNLPALNFPEISMDQMTPWGGFGANPRPAHWQGYWNSVGDKLAGGLPYSEGIFEDFNKVLHLQLNWDNRRTTRDIAREYVVSEFGAKFADEIVAAIEAMEAALDHTAEFEAARALANQTSRKNPPTAQVYRLPNVATPVGYAASLRKIDKKLPAKVRRSWRWRILLLRALLDEELQRSAGRPTRVSDKLFEELNRIYHARKSEWIVCAPSRTAMRQRRAKIGWPEMPRATRKKSRKLS